MITERTKTGRKTITFPKYDLSENLDVSSCLEFYIVATQTKRDKDDDKQQFLISYKSPFQPVTTPTIARWLRTIVSEAGIDTSKYKAHLTRAVATLILVDELRMRSLPRFRKRI